jgi:uncharacterized membrane protein YraQ (UPF0718 family)
MKMMYFPISVILIYGAVFAIAPDRAFIAVKNSGIILFRIIIPLVLVFVLMMILNIFLKPAYIAGFLGKKSGLKGVIFSMTAGIISTGPIYAWYPVLKNLKEKGAGNLPVAVFINSRAVKPFLLPVMISYFGYLYVAVLTLFTIMGSFAAGYLTESLTREKTG